MLVNGYTSKKHTENVSRLPVVYRKINAFCREYDKNAVNGHSRKERICQINQV